MSYWFASVHLTRGGVLHFRFEAVYSNAVESIMSSKEGLSTRPAGQQLKYKPEDDGLFQHFLASDA
jgi:hypothetical protein